MEYITIGDIKEAELAMIGVVASKGTASTPPTEIVGSRVGRIPLGPSCNKLFIGGGRGSTSLCEVPLGFSFNSNWSLKDLFSSLNFDRAEYKASISRLNMLFDDSIPFSIHSIVYSFELRSSFARFNSSLRESISLGSDELIWTGSSTTPPLHPNYDMYALDLCPPTYLPIHVF
ncbi:unnamed protein product [Rhizophagus irregularis]|nr:unnamed protein product [Rhizophagus irregularis]